MRAPYDASSWHTVYSMLGGSAAALAGLLFVAVSIQIRRIAQSPIYRARAWANTFLIVMLVIDAAMVLVPQSTTALGVELMIPSAVFIGLLVNTMVGVQRAGLQLPWRPFVSIALNVAGIVGALSLIARWGGGMYVVTADVLAIIVWVMYGAWGLLLAIGEDESATR